MGNSQLLPLVLATIIVGVAIVRGLEMHRQENLLQNQEGIRNKLLDIAGRAQTWYFRPVTMGGGGRSFASVNWKKLGINPITPVGNFTISDQTEDQFRVSGTSLEDSTHILSYAIIYPDSVIFLP